MLTIQEWKLICDDHNPIHDRSHVSNMFLQQFWIILCVAVNLALIGIIIWMLCTHTNKPFNRGTGGRISLSSWHFILSASPAFFISWPFNQVWVNADLFYRTNQPIASMEYPAKAKDSLLLNYVAGNPISTMLAAFDKHNWHVFFFVIAVTLRPFIATLAGNVFLTIQGNDEIIIKLNVIPLCICLAVLVLDIPILIWVVPPPLKFRVPRSLRSPLDVMLYCSQSPLAKDVFVSVDKPDDEEEHLLSHVHLEKQQYQFGFYRGLDGQRHLGIDYARTISDGNGGLEPIKKEYLGNEEVYTVDFIKDKPRSPAWVPHWILGESKPEIRQFINVKNAYVKEVSKRHGWIPRWILGASNKSEMQESINVKKMDVGETADISGWQHISSTCSRTNTRESEKRPEAQFNLKQAITSALAPSVGSSTADEHGYELHRFLKIRPGKRRNRSSTELPV
jgi:hypothetical protein